MLETRLQNCKLSGMALRRAGRHTRAAAIEQVGDRLSTRLREQRMADGTFYPVKRPIPTPSTLTPEEKDAQWWLVKRAALRRVTGDPARTARIRAALRELEERRPVLAALAARYP